MQGTEVRNEILKQLNLTPTQDQFRFIKSFSDFIAGELNVQVFILRGYAGTGKTTMVNTLVKALPQLKLYSILLAPTGRAAKVLTLYTGKRASTIHRKIYQTVDRGGGSIGFRLAKNNAKNTVFFVDEASMINGKSQHQGEGFGQMHLLADLIDFVRDGENCQLVFIGDIAQLPPVNEKVSPALSKSLLRGQYGLDSEMVEIREVLRQAKDSGVLFNATKLRDQLFNNEFTPQFDLTDFTDIQAISGAELSDFLEDSYGRSGVEQTLLLCRSNKSANKFNHEIRHRILFREERIEGGDMLMVVKNNYFWIEATSKPGFIANGDALEVLSVGQLENKYGFEFATVEVRMVDYPNEKPINVKVLLDTLYVESPSLQQKDLDRLYNELMVEYSHFKNKKAIHFKIKEDPYYNALQIKFAYAVTCHKAQGGQWKEIYIDQGYLNPDHMGVEYTRWLYTAITRATQQVFLVNFNPTFFSDYE